jgi:aryl-phospho-beta-D-glucosidase BglC (GH1 family)
MMSRSAQLSLIIILLLGASMIVTVSVGQALDDPGASISTTGMVVYPNTGKLQIAAINVQFGGGQGLTLSELQYIKSLGFNTVRLTVPLFSFLPTNNHEVRTAAFTTDLSIGNTVGLDTYISMVKQAGLKTLLTLYTAEVGAYPSWAYVGITDQDLRHEREFTVGTLEHDGVLNCWAAIADRYKGESSVMFEFLNEPAIKNRAGPMPTNYKNLAEAWVDRIVAVETVNHLKIVELLCAASSYEEVLDEQPDVKPGRVDVVYSSHCYEPWGGYDPNAPVSGPWGTKMSEYVLWRQTRVDTWVKGKGKLHLNTEFGYDSRWTNQILWLQYVTGNFKNLNTYGWTFHAWDRFDHAGFDIMDSSGNLKTPIWNVLKTIMPTG